MHPTRVTLDITADGWSQTVWSGDTILATYVMQMRSNGGSKGDLSDLLPEWRNLVEEIPNGFGVASELSNILEMATGNTPRP